MTTPTVGTESILNYLGNTIPFEQKNGFLMLNATAMARIFNKVPRSIMYTKHWKSYEQIVKEELEEEIVSTETLEPLKTPNNYLSVYLSNGQPFKIIAKGISGESKQGTWLHPELAIRFAQHLDLKFERWVNKTVKHLIDKNEK